jgi:hypothetical protein
MHIATKERQPEFMYDTKKILNYLGTDFNFTANMK